MSVFFRRSGALLAALIVGLGSALGAVSARAETKEITIGIQYGLGFLPITVAQAQGFYAAEARKAGLDDLQVNIQYISGSPAMNDALLSESIEIAAYGTPGLLIVWDKTRGRQDVNALAAVSAYTYSLYVNRPEIKSLGDFGDEDRIAVAATSSPQTFLMRMAAEKFFGHGQHGRLDKLFVSMPHPDAMVALLAGRAITGYMASPPFIAALRDNHKVHSVITTREILGGEEPTGVVLGVGKKFVAANPNVARAVIEALDDAVAFIAKEPDKAAAIYLQTESAKVSKAEVMSMLGDGSMIYSVTPSGVMKYARFMAKTGWIKHEPQAWQDVFFPLLHARNGN
jgi:NitT/TauT family transport system substrate-binding protein